MLLTNIPPAKHLHSFIRFYRIIDFDFSRQEKDFPNVKAYRPRIEHCLQFTPFDNEIVNYIDKEISHKVALFGQQTVLTQRKVGKRFLNFQVVFQPGVLHSIFKIPMHELSNVYIDAELFFGKGVHDINEQLASCKSYDEMIVIVEIFLGRLISKNQPELHPINHIARLFTRTTNTHNIEWFAGQANLSYRQFDRAFKANTGVAPKDFRNLVKLDLAYLLKNRNPAADWFSIALQSGFYDYQHLAKNYKKFIGYLPTAFYQLEQLAPERLFGDYEQ